MQVWMLTTHDYMVVETSEKVLKSRPLGSLRNCQTPKINAKQNGAFHSQTKRRLANYISKTFTQVKGQEKWRALYIRTLKSSN